MNRNIDIERFTQILPGIAHVKPIVNDGEANYWEVLDKSGVSLGYAFMADVPEAVADVAEMQDMDKYQVIGIIDPREYKVIALDITIHPQGPEDPWATEITEPDFEKQYIGLTAEQIELSPDGKIDAISESTLSSTWVTNAIRDRVQRIIEKTKAKS